MLDVNTYASLPAKLRLERSHFQCMSHNDFALLSGFFMLGRSEIVQNIPTACTDGVNKKYGEAFVLTLSEPEMNALVLHENGHIMLRHMPMYKNLYKEDAECANKACDYVINGWIVDTDPQGLFAKLPAGGCYNPDYSNLTVKEIYDILRKEKEGEPEEEGNKPGDKPGEGGQGGFDEHDWEGTEEAEEELGGAEEVGKLVEQAIREG
jgi:predicted metal-dependent peptidase